MLKVSFPKLFHLIRCEQQVHAPATSCGVLIYFVILVKALVNSTGPPAVNPLCVSF